MSLLPPLPTVEETDDSTPVTAVLAMTNEPRWHRHHSARSCQELPGAGDTVPIPAKLRKWILDLEFIEMSDLLLESMEP